MPLGLLFPLAFDLISMPLLTIMRGRSASGMPGVPRCSEATLLDKSRQHRRAVDRVARVGVNSATLTRVLFQPWRDQASAVISFFELSFSTSMSERDGFQRRVPV